MDKMRNECRLYLFSSLSNCNHFTRSAIPKTIRTCQILGEERERWLPVFFSTRTTNCICNLLLEYLCRWKKHVIVRKFSVYCKLSICNVRLSIRSS